jgi:hypothetical protein
MAFEINRPPEETGVGFTNRFAVSDNLLDWKLTPAECVFTKDRYSACPAIRYGHGFYYLIYLEMIWDGKEATQPKFDTHIVRSQDLQHWESSPYNPMLRYGDEDRVIANPKLTACQRQRIARAVNINNSDLDLCEFRGQVLINYSWGNQRGIEHLAQAVYDGPLADLLEGFFA